MSFRRILPALILVAVFATCCSPAMAPTPTAIPLPPEPETSPTPGVTAAPTTTPLPAVTPPDPYPGGLSQNWWRDGVFYVLLVRSFYDQSGDGYGDLAGLIDKLDYLNDGDPSTDTDLG
ncbi:MAG TPA: alpha-amylase, partial [Anaerolineae bacterium]|nr:alpha-amylase [Anaerolineae bacterium]